MVIFILALLGLAWGSFVNAAVWRLRQQETAKKLSKKQKQALSIARGRSMCVNCKHPLAWYDLLPVISWLSLAGKCRYCKKPISWQYPVVELITAGLFVLSYAYFPIFHFPYSIFQFGLWLVFVVAFMALAVYDFRWMLLPDKIVFPLIGLAILYQALRVLATGDLLGVVSGVIGGFLAIGGLFYALFKISDGKWIGGGDVKLGFVIGILIADPIKSILIIFLASVMGTIAAVPLLRKKSLDLSSRLPFGPFLLAATVIVFLFGGQLIDWYLGLII